MRNHLRVASFSIAFYWIGLTSAPGTPPAGETTQIGLVGTVAAIAGFGLVAFLRRDALRAEDRRG